MSITLIPFIIPLLWSLFITAYWRMKMKEPINHWAICALVFAINIFWFAYSCVIFLTLMVIHFLKKKEDKKEDGTTK
jgi:hypothetical protein